MTSPSSSPAETVGGRPSAGSRLDEIRVAHPRRTAVARATAVFLAGFTLLNLAGDGWTPGFDANLWWLDLRPLPSPVARTLLAVSSLAMLAWAVRPAVVAFRWGASLATVALLIFAVSNAVHFYGLMLSGLIRPGVPLPFSLWVALALLGVLWSAAVSLSPAPPSPRARRQARLAGLTTLAVLIIGFPLAQMFCFGRTDYRRPAQAAVVFGARAYTDGTCSDALRDRVLTACRLYHAGLAPWLIFSGGPGDGAVHETEAMARLAVEQGVPRQQIILDPDGLNTDATVENTCRVFEDRGFRSVLAVSHAYHLPRVKMRYQRAGREVYTVPAEETYVLTQMPYLMLREVVALWVYYLRPLIGR